MQRAGKSVHIRREWTQFFASAKYHTARCRSDLAEYRAYPCEVPCLGYADLHGIERAEAQPAKGRSVERGIGQHEGDRPAGTKITLGAARPEQRGHVLLRRQHAADPQI